MKKINKIGILSVYTLLVIIMLSETALAYIDPSVMTYAIQAVAGIVIAVGAFIGIYFRKIKKNVQNKLGIDENKNKEVESDEIKIEK
ncbi:putative uncharacterized protein [Mycoplasma sp. CAG:956]|nr:hypothetical protein [Bacilli bacterium]CCY89132.1 putative uncharacterized protein [Mycoplasma sp. CAG:956]